MSGKDLRVTLVQADTVWHDAAANRARHTEMMERAAGALPSDVYVLPETFSTGFSNEAVTTAETMDGETVAWLRDRARALDAAVTGSVQIRDGEAVYNRLLWATPDGGTRWYDKRHLFSMAGEHERYAAGRERLVVEWRGWRICPLVCYDLRFPVFSRNRVVDGAPEYDALLYVANWPTPRHHAWRTLLRARAIENLCYVAGVNRAGVDGNGHAYSGGSAVVDFLGEELVWCDAAAQLASVVLSWEGLRGHRARFPAHLDADTFTLGGA